MEWWESGVVGEWRVGEWSGVKWTVAACSVPGVLEYSVASNH